MDESNREFKSLPTGITTLDALLAPRRDPAQLSGFAHLAAAGFFGVIFGPSNSGKSILSLQLACRFASPLSKNGQMENRGIAIYISQEPIDIVKARIVSSFGFLTIGQIGTSLNDLETERRCAIILIQMPLDPIKQQEQLIDVFEFINSRFCCLEKDKWGGEQDPKGRVLVVVDNAETIRIEAYLHLIGLPSLRLPDVRSESGRREFCKLLREYCFKHRLKVWFSFEEDAAQSTFDESSRASTSAETYAADAVIRLGLTVLDGTFSERSLEIIKARDQFYRRGRHHFSIRGLISGGFSGPSATDNPEETGMIVYPSLPTQLHTLSREGSDDVETPPGRRWKLGIPSIDDAVLRANEGSRGLNAKEYGYLARGTVAVLVADLDSVGTDLALHFAAQNSLNDHNWLYVSFHHEPHMLRKIARGYTQTTACADHLYNTIRYSETRPGRCLFFPPEYISESKLLHDIDRNICKYKGKTVGGPPLRVVVDDLFALDKRFTLLRDKDDFIAALFELFRRRGVTALVLDSVEVGEGRNPLEQSVPAGMADHVFLLRHVEFQTRTRKVFSILKIAELNEPALHWELTNRRESGGLSELVGDASRFEFFKGLLSGRPEPVEITLSLYADSPASPQHRHLETQQKILSKTFGQHIEIHPCHPDDYVALQQTVGQIGLPVLGDCHIISVDEIWLDALIKGKRLTAFLDDDDQNREAWDNQDFVSVAHDLACEQHSLPTSGPKRRHFAIPDRHNCGVLASDEMLESRVSQRADFGGVKRTIDDLKGKPLLSWDTLVDLQSQFVQLHHQKHGFLGDCSPSNYRDRETKPKTPKHAENSGQSAIAKDGIDDQWGVFTFNMENRESCVSFLFELVLSKLKQNDCLVDGNGRLNWRFHGYSPWLDGLGLMMSLLDPWDIHRLAEGSFRPCQLEHPCRFSRQWFTSWGALSLRFPGIRVAELPEGVAGRTTVSGTWYLAMLAESSAISAGKALIRRLTAREDELHRINNGIGLPVHAERYQNPLRMDIIPVLPYAAQFAEIPNVLKAARLSGSDPRLVGRPFHDALRKSRCPFHRSTIKEYSKLSPILMGLIIKAARIVVAANDWIITRAEALPNEVVESVNALIQQAERDIGSVQRDTDGEPAQALLGLEGLDGHS